MSRFMENLRAFVDVERRHGSGREYILAALLTMLAQLLAEIDDADRRATVLAMILAYLPNQVAEFRGETWNSTLLSRLLSLERTTQ